MRDLIIEKNTLSSIINDPRIEKKRIVSRFGEIEIDLSKSILFEEGFVGVTGREKFCLTHFPSSNFSNFKILQSVNEADLSFIILPLGSVENASRYIAKEDIESLLSHLGISSEHAILLLIISIHSKIDNKGRNITQVSANLRAPIIIDSFKLKGFQFLLNNDEYPVQYIISEF